MAKSIKNKALNRILVDREELIRSEPEKVRDFARSSLNDLIGDASFRVYRYPAEDRDVADEPRLSLVVLDLPVTSTGSGLGCVPSNSNWNRRQIFPR